MKKRILAAMIAAATVLSLAGCKDETGSSGDSGNSSSNAGNSGTTSGDSSGSLHSEVQRV